MPRKKNEEAVGVAEIAEGDPAQNAYELFRKAGEAEGDFPAWEELTLQTQALWRQGYEHVANGGAPRTDYEHAVKYLIASAA